MYVHLTKVGAWKNMLHLTNTFDLNALFDQVSSQIYSQNGQMFVKMIMG
jgi:hypothetical protein